jgi:DNA-binding NarL/FixJ family response regulator
VILAFLCVRERGNQAMRSQCTARTRILIVEDDEACRAHCAGAIARDPSLTVAAICGSVREACAAIRREPIDVALVDLGLPDGSGLDVVKTMRRNQPACDIMIMSIFDDEEVFLEAISLGATGYLLKHDGPTDIATAIRALRAGGAPISPMLARLLLERARPTAPHAAALSAEALALSEREIEILRIIARGLSLGEIAGLLSISVNTVKTHVKRIYQKLAVSSRTEAIFEAQCMGLLPSTGGRNGGGSRRRALDSIPSDG